MTLMSTLRVDAGGGAGGVWGPGTLGTGAGNAGCEDATGKVCYYDCRGECLRDSGANMMSMGG